MADPRPEANSGDERGRGARPDSTGRPRWVKAFGLIALLAAVLFVVLKLTGLGGEHGPGRHNPGGRSHTTPGTPGHTGPPPGVTHGERRP